jgi:hypothetical protein
MKPAEIPSNLEYPSTIISTLISVQQKILYRSKDLKKPTSSSSISKTTKMGFTSYSGPASSFPPMSSWATFETIFNNNKTEMFATGDTNNDVGFIWNAVNEAAKIGVEERVIFCIIMQESTGNVGVQSTTAPDGSTSAGLMQCDGSPGFPGKHGLSQVSYTLKATTSDIC